MSTQLERKAAATPAAMRGTSTAPDAHYFGHEDPAHVLRLQQRYRATLRLLSDLGWRDLGGVRILDVGCGDGTMLCEYVQWGVDPSRAAGIDLSSAAIDRARARLPHAELVVGSAAQLPWPDERFDAVSANTVFSSILDPDERTQVATEMVRVLKPDGLILWYDTVRENPHNPGVRAVPVEELRELFAGLHITLRKITFLPHIARRWPPAVLEVAYNLLALLPGCRSHALAAIRK